VTYAEFHLYTNLPALLLLLWLTRGMMTRAHWLAIAGVALVATAAATPWDNIAVHRGIWGFDWDRATPVEIPFRGVTYRLPAEEYAFFVIESVLVSLFAIWLLGRSKKPRPEGRP
jgi:putative membrane protein